MSTASADDYYIPGPTHWPIVGSIGLTTTVVGFARFLHGAEITMMLLGIAIVIFMIYGWFGQVINESIDGRYNKQVDMSFRWGMGWFIFSEVMFFAAFFGALFYARMYAIPWLGGASNNDATAWLLWPDFEATWPLIAVPMAENFEVAKQAMGAWGLPALNTAILLTSGLTVTLAHHALKRQDRVWLVYWLFATVFLGFLFVGLQALEYSHAYSELNLRLDSGIYGSTFYMLTGFHGFHVTMGAVMLTVILIRAMKGHFTPENHFGFEAVAWYWHFVDVVWLGLFIFVYWI
ncbi:MAG: cytochrome c oxidase subunit 3 [Gammaproteobacteria bacterium]|nr:MAG: cytochrome c oxidase subunit 3 [Gammaproteobacteria bacterium]